MSERNRHDILAMIHEATGAERVSIHDFVELVPGEPPELQNPPCKSRILITLPGGAQFENVMPKDMLDDPTFDVSGYFKREIEKANDRIDRSDPEHVRLLHKARLLLRCVLEEGFNPEQHFGLALNNHVVRIDKFIDAYKAARNAGAGIEPEDPDRRCTSCRHAGTSSLWSDPDMKLKDVTVCGKLVQSIASIPENRMMIVPQFDESSFIVPDDFGCSMWEAATDE